MIRDDTKKKDAGKKEEKSAAAKFKDDMFPASSTSLFWEKFIGKKQNDTVENFKRVKQFSHIDDINKTGSLWGERASQVSKHLKQGLLTDCWVTGAAAALYETPASLERIFKQK